MIVETQTISLTSAFMNIINEDSILWFFFHTSCESSMMGVKRMLRYIFARRQEKSKAKSPPNARRLVKSSEVQADPPKYIGDFQLMELDADHPLVRPRHTASKAKSRPPLAEKDGVVTRAKASTSVQPRSKASPRNDGCPCCTKLKEQLMASNRGLQLANDQLFSAVKTLMLANLRLQMIRQQRLVI